MVDKQESEQRGQVKPPGKHGTALCVLRASPRVIKEGPEKLGEMLGVISREVMMAELQM